MSETKKTEPQLLEKVKDFCSIGLFTFVIALCAFTYIWNQQSKDAIYSEVPAETLESKHSSVEYKNASQSSE